MTRSDSAALDCPSLSGSRMSAVSERPKLCAENSPRFSLSIAARTRLKSTGWPYVTSITVPPRKSTPMFKPMVARKITASRNVTADTTLNASACRMNGMSCWILKNSMCFPCFDSDRRGYAFVGAVGAVPVGCHTCPMEILSSFLRLP